MTIITISHNEPVTFDGDADTVGLVHRYADHNVRHLETACGIPLAFEHAVVSPASTKPLCSGCWA